MACGIRVILTRKHGEVVLCTTLLHTDTLSCTKSLRLTKRKGRVTKLARSARAMPIRYGERCGGSLLAGWTVTITMIP